jgi:uncharacterized protein YbjT (DUF2867 family)
MPVYAVTGASGHLGRFAIEQLLARGVPPPDVVAVVRDRRKATSLAGLGGETSSQDLPELLGRPATPLTEVIRAAYDAVLTAPRDNGQ